MISKDEMQAQLIKMGGEVFDRITDEYVRIREMARGEDEPLQICIRHEDAKLLMYCRDALPLMQAEAIGIEFMNMTIRLNRWRTFVRRL